MLPSSRRVKRRNLSFAHLTIESSQVFAHWQLS
jgi:hypothetical protein